MKISARSQFRGTVTHVVLGPVSTEVTIKAGSVPVATD